MKRFVNLTGSYGFSPILAGWSVTDRTLIVGISPSWWCERSPLSPANLHSGALVRRDRVKTSP
ncbi:MAG: hypothetical protein AAFQ89_14480 [Cyanobacteria bacterium J06626_18]